MDFWDDVKLFLANGGALGYLNGFSAETAGHPYNFDDLKGDVENAATKIMEIVNSLARVLEVKE